MVQNSNEEVLGRRKVAWGAVFAGLVVVLVVQLVFSVLGVAFGAGSIDALEEAKPVQGLAMSTGIWFVATSLISLFAGGWVSGRLAAVRSHIDSSLHGVVTWGLATLVSAVLLTSAVGKVVSGTVGLLGDVLGVAGEGVKAAAPEIAKAVGLQDLDLGSIKSEARKMLVQTRKPELQPKNLERSARATGEDAKDAAGEAAMHPETADAELDTLLDRVFAKGKTVVDAADKEAVVNVIVARTDMTREQAGQTFDQWQSTIATARQKVEEAAGGAEQKTREVADNAAEGVSQAAVWMFIGLVLGAIAAAFGGWLGAPDRTTPFRLRHIEPDERAAA